MDNDVMEIRRLELRYSELCNALECPKNKRNENLCEYGSEGCPKVKELKSKMEIPPSNEIFSSLEKDEEWIQRHIKLEDGTSIAFFVELWRAQTIPKSYEVKRILVCSANSVEELTQKLRGKK